MQKSEKAKNRKEGKRRGEMRENLFLVRFLGSCCIVIRGVWGKGTLIKYLKETIPNLQVSKLNILFRSLKTIKIIKTTKNYVQLILKKYNIQLYVLFEIVQYSTPKKKNILL